MCTICLHYICLHLFAFVLHLPRLSAEWWVFELNLVLCGFMPNPRVSIATYGILVQLASIAYMFPLSLLGTWSCICIHTRFCCFLSTALCVHAYTCAAASQRTVACLCLSTHCHMPFHLNAQSPFDHRCVHHPRVQPAGRTAAPAGTDCCPHQPPAHHPDADCLVCGSVGPAHSAAAAVDQ